MQPTRDPLPGVPPAGYVRPGNEENVGVCIHAGSTARATTPPQIKRFRGVAMQEPGTITRHWGTANDPVPPPYQALGERSNHDGVSAADLVSPPNRTRFQQLVDDQLESHYQSHQREPLGASFRRGLPVPELSFGKPSNSSECSKELIFPQQAPAEEAPQRSGRVSNPPVGAQMTRGYRWEGTPVQDPTTFTFGAPSGGAAARAGGEARAALSPAIGESAFNASHIVKKTCDDCLPLADDCEHINSLLPFVHAAFDHARAPNLAPDHVFGYKPRGALDSTASLIDSRYAPPEAKQPDRDLGHSVRPGHRNVASPDRVFGVPSVRHDLPVPKMRSIADSQCYGDEAGAQRAVQPFAFAHLGLEDSDFLQMYTRKDLHSLIIESGAVEMAEDEFEALCMAAQRASGLSTTDKVPVTLASFRDQLIAWQRALPTPPAASASR